jgi:hypothetical protein
LRSDNVWLSANAVFVEIISQLPIRLVAMLLHYAFAAWIVGKAAALQRWDTGLPDYMGSFSVTVSINVVPQ